MKTSCGVCGVIVQKGKCACADQPHRQDYINKQNKRRGKLLMNTKEERACKNDMDMNCNACLNLQRIKHPKDPDGFLYGSCKLHPYTNSIKFHPDDYMGMPCFINRDTKQPSILR